MPLVLLFGHLALERGRLRWVVLCGVAAGLQLLAGHPEEWVYTLFALAAAMRLGGAMVALGLLFAWQLLPTLLLQRHGWRTAPGFDEQYELPPQLAFNALLPDYGNTLSGENVGFIGLVALGLAGLGIWAGPRRLAWMRAWALGLSLFGLLMALGDHSPLYRLVAGHLRLVAEFRVPARYLLLLYLPLAAAAALGTDALLERDVGRPAGRVRQGLGGLAVVGLVLGVALVAGGHSGWVDSRAWWAAAAAAGLLAWAAAGLRWVPRAAVAVVLLGVTAVELGQARPAAEYHQLVPTAAYDDPGPVMERLGREGGRYVSIAWDAADTPDKRRALAGTVPAGLTPRMRRGWRLTWPRRLAARPAWEYATGAETITGRDGGLLPLRTYQELFAAAVNPAGRLSAGVTVEGPSRWGWPALDPLGVRCSSPEACPPTRSRCWRPMASGSCSVTPGSCSGSGRPRRWPAWSTRSTPSPTRPSGWPGSRPATRCWIGPWSSGRSPACAGRRPRPPSGSSGAPRPGVGCRSAPAATACWCWPTPGTRSGGSRSTAARPSCSGSTTPCAACACPPATTRSCSPTRTAPSSSAWPSPC